MSTIQGIKALESRNFQEERDRGFWSPSTAFEVEDLKSNELLVFLTLCYHANYTTGEAWPGFDTIAKRSKLSRRTVINAISSLVEKGYILKLDTDPETGQKYKSNHYIVLTPVVEKEETEQKVTARRRTVKARERVISAEDAPSPVQEMHPTVDNSVKVKSLTVQEMHPTSAGDAPEHNYLTELDLKDLKNVCMYDAHDSSESVLQPSEKEKTVNTQKKKTPAAKEHHFGVKAALRRCALNRLYRDHHKGMNENDIDAIFCLLTEDFPNNLNEDLVYKACELYELKTDPQINGKLNFDVKDCIRLFRKQYERAILLQQEEIYEFTMKAKQQKEVYNFQRMA